MRERATKGWPEERVSGNERVKGQGGSISDFKLQLFHSPPSLCDAPLKFHSGVVDGSHALGQLAREVVKRKTAFVFGRDAFDSEEV